MRNSLINALYVDQIKTQGSSVIELLPNSLCSWNFTARGLAAGTGSIAYDWITEQGMIAIGPVGYDVRKHGYFSGHWTLDHSGLVIAQAQKPSALFRSFEVSSEGLHFTLRAQSPFQRAFVIESDGQVLGEIAPVHAFTRRAVMECSATIPENIQLFSFWLVALTWRRSARNNSGAH